MTTKRFIKPFGEDGLRVPISDTPSGTDVNYETGYPEEYGFDPVTDPAARFVELTQENQILNDITGNIKLWQEDNYPDFITAANNGGVAHEYKKGIVVSYNGELYESLEDANTDLPTTEKWVIHKPNDVLRALLIGLGYSGNYGFFEKGFVYREFGDIGFSSDGVAYIYAGVDLLPVTVPNGTDPEVSSDYESVIFNKADASNVELQNQSTVQNFFDGQSFVNVNAMVNYSEISALEGFTVETNGRNSAGDGGGGSYLVLPIGDYIGSPDGFIDLLHSGGAYAFVRQVGIVLDIRSIGVFDGSDATNALLALAERMKTSSIEVLPWFGNFNLSDTVQFRETGIHLRGYSQDLSSITITDNTKYGLDFFAVGSGKSTMRLSSCEIIGKYGVKTRFDQNTDFENDANPIKHYIFEDVRFTGTYDAANDPAAGNTSVPLFSTLTALGVGLFLTDNYRTEVKNCEFELNGIGLVSMGCTLSKYARNRFKNNARHIHDQRHVWYNSGFGMGADNIIEQNDFLDGTRDGGVTLLDTFGTNFRNNYMEHLDRGGISASPVMLYCQNVSHTMIECNHFNASLSVQQARPFMRYFFNDGYVGEASNNRLTNNNRLTPFANVEDAFIQFGVDNYDLRYPIILSAYGNSQNFPRIDAPYVSKSEDVNLALLRYDNIHANQNLSGGSISLNDKLWVRDGIDLGWYLATSADNATTPALNILFETDNYNRASSVTLRFVADDNTGGGTGRLDINVTDETGLIYNGFAFNNISVIGVYDLAIPISNKRNKSYQVNMTNLSFAKVYSVEVIY